MSCLCLIAINNACYCFTAASPLSKFKYEGLAVHVVVQLYVTGVAQVLNRLDGKPFDDADQRLFEVHLSFLYHSVPTVACKRLG